MFLCLLGEVVSWVKLLAIYFTANGQQKLTDRSIPSIPIKHKEKNKSKKKDSSTGVFCEFFQIFKNTFFKNISGGCF